MTTAAPRNCAECAAARPTGPAPAMYTVEPETPVWPSLQLRQAPTGDVEGHRDQVALLDELHVAPGFDDLSCDLVTEDQPSGAVVRPRTMCWSEPQMLVETILRITP
jgi:hypothetical protein